MADLHLDIQLSLELRMAEFKSDPEKMKEVNDFLDDLFKHAVKEAEQRKGTEKKTKAVSLRNKFMNSISK